MRKDGAVVVLITEEVKAKLPKLYSQEKESDPVVQVKFFHPAGRFTFYAYEGQEDGEDYTMFGWTVSPLGPDCDELGYVSAMEMASVRDRFGLGIERDLFFTPCKLSEVRGH